ncbi:MAG: alanine racemase [Clostridia bacterium]|nr:alanine racemase [Clostridia bacterium]
MNKYIVEKDKLINNINIIKQMTDSTVIAMIKCNGYGLGLIPFAKILTENGIKILAVSEIEEAVTLKNAFPETDILLLTSYATRNDCEKIAENNIIATVGSVDSAKALEEAGKKFDTIPKAHIEINTGMGRCGFDYNDIDLILSLKEYNIDYCGTFSHFSFSFSKNKNDTLEPLSSFKNCVEALNKNGFATGALHISNSSAFLNCKESHLDCVRVGSAFLGRILGSASIGFQKVGFLESEIVDTNFLKKGSNIGYGNTYNTTKDTKTAIVPVGYAHGFMTEKSRDTFRLRDKIRYILSDLKTQKHYVEICGKKAEILGRTGMFNIICDITDIDAKPGDKVILQANPILLSDTIEREYR